MSAEQQRDIDLIVAGHLCLDIIPEFPTSGQMTVEQVFTPGRLVNVGQAIISTGGPVSNTGIALTKLGQKVSFLARVGDDQFGKLTMEKLRQVAGTESISVIQGEHSSYTLVIAPPGIDRIFFHSPSTNNTFCSADVQPEFCQRAKIFHLGYPPLMRRLYQEDGKELIACYRKAKQAGATTSLDMSLPDPASESGKVDWKAILQELLPYVDLFLPSIEEAVFMAMPERYRQVKAAAGTDDVVNHIPADHYTALSDMFLAWGSKIVALKAGLRGFYLRTAGKELLTQMGATQPKDLENWSNRQLWSLAFKLDKIASATGSGDCAVAGFLAAYLNGQTVQQAIACANAMGFQNVHTLDAVSGISNWAQTLAIANDRNKQRRHFDISAAGWRFDKENYIWYGPNDQSAKGK